MSIKYLRNLTKLDHGVVKKTTLTGEGETFIDIDESKSTLTFKLQQGPIKDGINGCTTDDMIHAIKLIIAGENDENPSNWTTLAVQSLEQATQYLKTRNKSS